MFDLALDPVIAEPRRCFVRRNPVRIIAAWALVVGDCEEPRGAAPARMSRRGVLRLVRLTGGGRAG
ncbi:hypothetical protein GCM10020229_38240 [Kitasatospora albolonga]